MRKKDVESAPPVVIETPTSNEWSAFPIAVFQDRLPSVEERKGLKKKVKRKFKMTTFQKYYRLQDEIISSFHEIDKTVGNMPKECISEADLPPAETGRDSQEEEDSVSKNALVTTFTSTIPEGSITEDVTVTPGHPPSVIPGIDQTSTSDDSGQMNKTNNRLHGSGGRRCCSCHSLHSNMQTLLAQTTLLCNVCLLIAKAVVVGLSGSLAIISSLMDSCVDLVTGGALWWTARQMKTRDLRDYPQGRTRLEPVVIIILSVIMSVTSFQIIRESIEVVIEMSKGKGAPDMGNASIAIAAATVGIKVILFIICSRYGTSPSIAALAQDHRNDVVSNLAALIFSALSGRVAEAIMNGTGQTIQVPVNRSELLETNATISVYQQGNLWLKEFKYLDPIGAILIALYIIRSWWNTGKEHVQSLTGHVASPEFHQQLCYLALSHHPEVVAVDTVMAFHLGQNFLVEVDIVLPGDMPLLRAHNIGEALQRKLEALPEVERAFVHLDYESDHSRTYEHKVL